MKRSLILLAVAGLVAVGIMAFVGSQDSDTALDDARVHDIITAYIQNENDDEGLFPMEDAVENRTRRLSFGYVHDTVKRTEDGQYFACVDFTEASDDTLDLDFYVTPGAEGGPRVSKAVIHKVNGQSRF